MPSFTALKPFNVWSTNTSAHSSHSGTQFIVSRSVSTLAIVVADLEPQYRLLRTPSAANVAGSVVILDPTKLLDGLMDSLDAVKGLVKAVVDIIAVFETLGAMSSSTSAMYNGTKRVIRIRPSQWHVALRYTDLLIRGRQTRVLESLLNSPNFPLAKDKHVLCGFCSQLEQAANEGGNGSPAITILKGLLKLKGSTSSSRRARAWVRLTIPNVQLAKLSRSQGIKSRVIRAFDASTFKTTIGYSKAANDGLENEGELPKKAWETCPETSIFYADQGIRDFYTNKDLQLLDVVRLDHTKCLPMAQYYINLSIVEGNGGKDSGDRAPSSFPGHRLDIGEAGGARKVSLPDIF